MGALPRKPFVRPLTEVSRSDTLPHRVRGTSGSHGPACRNVPEAGLESAPVATADVEAYLSELEEPKRGTLQTLRSTILGIVPDAEQVIS